MSGLPNLPPGLPKGLKDYLVKLGEQFEVTQSDRGSPLLSKPTIQDLIDLGVLKSNQGADLQANGKSFSLDSPNWLQSGIPDWFTAFVNPPAPAGLTVGMNTSNIVLAWTQWASNYYQQTIVYRSSSNNLSTAVAIGSTTGNTYVDNLPPVGTSYYYWIRNQSKSTNLSDFNLTTGTTVGNAAGAPTLSYTFDGTDMLLTWPTPTTTLTVKYYIVRYGSTFIGGLDAGVSNTNTLRQTVTFGGTRKFWVAAVDINDNVGAAGFIDVTVTAPGAPTVGQAITNDTLILTYSSSPGSLPVASYEVRYGASFAAGTPVLIGSQTRYETSVNWTGSRTYWVRATDSAGNVSADTQSIFTPTAPSTVAVSAQVVDNNVLLSWPASTGTLTIASYLVDKGGVAYGTINGRFSAIYETVAGTFTYGVTPIDTAGNQGTRSTVSVVVAQPPDFFLNSSANSTFSGTLTNALIDAPSGGLICNVDTAESWDTHFTSRGWASPADQIAAGYSAYFVGKTTGQYKESVNYGGVINSSRVTMTATQYFASGSTMTTTPKLEAGTDGSTWPQSFPGVNTALISSFQYVRYTLDFSAAHNGTGLATDTSALLITQPLNYRLDVKLKTHQGMVSALAADSGGTSVDITGIFVDVSSISVSALGTTPLYVVYDFTDAPNPTTFKVLVFNSSGTRVNATVSYTLRGA
jgi:hypothetical protein